ncbi:MAG: hypothetical protein JXA11_06590 [Phycisphaerae bacterium]|nr:hypothetical protein [Phycisphaerae bacterium]
MKQTHAITWILVGMAGWTAAPARGQFSTGMLKMQKAVDYAHAGVIFSIPTGFSISPQCFGEFQVMLASRVEGKQATQSISLAAYPVDENTTPREVLKKLRIPLEESLSVIRFEVVKSVETTVAGLPAQVVHLAYTFRGIKTVTLSACFIRDVFPAATTKPAGATQPVGKRLAYVLTLEVAESHRQTMLKTFEAIVRTIMLTAITRPIDSEIDLEGPYLRDLRRGYALRMPVGWVGGNNDLGVFIEQSDYTLGGVPCPSVQAVSSLVEPSLTAESCGQKAIAYMKQRGASVEILSQGAVKFAKRDGWKIVLRKTVSPASQPAQTQPARSQPAQTTTLEVHYLLVTPPNEELYEEKARSYALIVAGQDVAVELLTHFAEQLADRFVVMPAREE